MPRSVRFVLACIAASVAAAIVPSGAGAAGWEPMTPALNGTGGQILHPSVAVDDVGNVYAAWTEGGLMEVSKRPVGGVFETPQTLDSTVNMSSNPDIGVDGAGNAVVVWVETVNSTHTIRQATRPTGASSFGQPGDVNTGSPSAKDNPKLAVNRAGEAVLAIQTPTTGAGIARVFLGSATGGFTAPFTEYSEGSNTSISPPDAAINEAGDAVVAWKGFSSGSTSMRAAYRPRGGVFGNREDIVPPASLAKFDPTVAIDSQGNALAVWDEAIGNIGQIRAYARPGGVGVAWSKVSDLDAPQNGAALPHAAFDADRNAVAAWNGGGELRASARPPGGVFAQPPQSLTGSGEQPADIGVDSGISGTTVLTWSGGGASPVVRAAVRPNGGAFGKVDTLSPSGHGGVATDVAVDPLGNAAAVWVDSNPPDVKPQLVTAEYDVTPPKFGTKTVDQAPTVGQPASYSATATDDWSRPIVSWDFGDGTSVHGGSVSHTYTKAGTYLASVTSLDGAGNASAQNFSVVVADTPTRGVDFNASSVSGKVLVSVPKNAPAGRVLARQPVARAAAAIKPPKGYRKFRPLGANDNIPVGSILDATGGVTQLTMAKNATGTTTQAGEFSQGVFKTQQSRQNALTTALMLGGGNFGSACKPFGFLAKKRTKPHRRLFGNVHGRFRTRGRHSTATVRGTKWTMTDTCSGTLTVVRSGSVFVRDFGTHKTVVVKAGHRYLAQSRKKR